VQFNHEGLTLWYGTEDTPAPQGKDVIGQGTCITVGVSPINSSNQVVVHYCVDGGTAQTLSAILVQTDHRQGKQYFRATFPDFWSGERVAYRAVLSCAGRQVPDIETARRYTESFALARSTSHRSHSPLNGVEPTSLRSTTRFPINLDYVARVTVQLQQSPEIIGETPEGLKVNWYLCSGAVVGPKLNAVFRPEGGDWMTLRPDGVGILDAHVTLETHDGALIHTTYSGVFDLGEDGYQNFLNQEWPHAPPLRSTPRFLTEHSQYKWLNRLQCIGVGEVRMSELLVVYDLYAL
jgi:hypothetical protein